MKKSDLESEKHRKHAELRNEIQKHDEYIMNLERQFAMEKKAAVEIMKFKVKETQKSRICWFIWDF